MDKDLNISIGSSRWSTSWPTSVMKWSEFCRRIDNPIRGSETLSEFLKMSKADQDARKDVGGFVGGVVEGGNRKVANVKSRDLVTLDLDAIPEHKTKDVLMQVQNLCCAAAVYSTRKHRPAAPQAACDHPHGQDDVGGGIRAGLQEGGKTDRDRVLRPDYL